MCKVYLSRGLGHAPRRILKRTATVERSFSQMKQIKTRLRSRLSDLNLPRLMRIAIEGPELHI